MTGSHFQFHSPYFFLLLLLVPLLFAFDLKKIRFVRFSISARQVLPLAAKKSWRQRLEFFPTLLKSLALMAVITALARPQYVNELTQVKADGIDILLTLDTSLSMQALDMRYNLKQITRLEAVKAVVAEFVAGRSYDRIGMVVFGEVAYTQCPLTLDYDVLRGFLDLIDSGIAGNGTAIGNGLAMAVKRLSQSDAKSRIIILLTDGRSDAGQVTPASAAEAAKNLGIKVYTIGVGSDRSHVPILLKDQNGQSYQDFASVGSVDSESLKQIAEITGGQYFRAQTLEVLQEVYQKIDTLEKSEVEMKRFQIYDERFGAFLAAAVILYVLHWLLRETVFFRLP